MDLPSFGVVGRVCVGAETVETMEKCSLTVQGAI